MLGQDAHPYSHNKQLSANEAKRISGLFLCFARRAAVFWCVVCRDDCDALLHHSPISTDSRNIEIRYRREVRMRDERAVAFVAIGRGSVRVDCM